MSRNEILEHISALLYTNVDDTIKNLDNKEIDNFIHFMAIEVQESLKQWYNYGVDLHKRQKAFNL